MSDKKYACEYDDDRKTIIRVTRIERHNGHPYYVSQLVSVRYINDRGIRGINHLTRLMIEAAEKLTGKKISCN